MDRRGILSAVGTMWILQLTATASEDPATEYSLSAWFRSPPASPLQGYVCKAIRDGPFKN